MSSVLHRVPELQKASWRAQQLISLPLRVTSSVLTPPPPQATRLDGGRKGREGSVSQCSQLLDSGGTYRTRHLDPYISAVQWRVAAFPRSPLSGI